MTETQPTTVRRARRFECAVDGVIESTEACCPVCTRPLAQTDGATQVRWGYSMEPDETRALCTCEHCPPDANDHTPAFEVTWVDTRRDYDADGCDVSREETARLIGYFDADGELVRDLENVERELFRICFPELAR